MTKIGNGRLITRDKEHPYYEKGAVVVEGERIVAVGNDCDIRSEYPDAEYIDTEGRVIMPGFINAHEHIYSAYARGLNIPGEPAKNFLEILDKIWWHIDRRLTLENTYYSALVVYLESIRNGVTFVSDHHASYGSVLGSLFQIGKAAKELNIRTCLAYEISDREGEELRDESIKENIDWLKYVEEENKSDSSRMLNGMVGMHASFTLSDETLAKCREANTRNAGYHIHVAEGVYDEQHCEEHYGISVIERLYQQGILGKDTVLGHCIHINEKDMDIIKDTGSMVVYNPESNMANAVGAPNVIGMLDKNILVGLGTDGYTNDMMESLKVANLLQKHRRGLPDRGFVEASNLLFENNAKIANNIIKDIVGVLSPGALADIIIVDYSPFTDMNESNIDGHIMFGIQGYMTDSVMINGKMIMQKGKMLYVDEEEIKRKSRESARKLWRVI